MELNFQKQSELEGKIVIKISEADYKDAYQNKLKEQAKKISLKGFRPGKVPMSVVQKMAGASVLADQIFALIDREINAYIKDNKLSLVGRPLPAESEKSKLIDWNVQKDFEFTYDIATVPAFDLNISKKLSFSNYQIVADEDKVKEVHESMLKRFGTHDQVEIVESNDLVKGNVKELGSDEDLKLNLWLEKLKSTSQKAFIGKKVKDIVSFDVQTLFDKDSALIAQFFGISKDEAASKEGEYEFEIISITRYTDAEVNQEYYDKIFGEGKVTDEAAYKAEISKNVTGGYAPNIEYLLFKEMRTEILKNNPIDISETFLKRWIFEANPEAKGEEVEKDFDKYVEEYKWSLVRNKIVEDNKIEVSYEEVKNDAFNRVVRQYLGGAEVNDEMKETFKGFIDKYLAEENGKNYYSHLENVLSSKVMDFLKENVTLKSQEVTTGEFEKIVEKSL